MQGLIKICDFGWSISSKTMRETFCGTPLYVSPELLKRKNYNNKIDVWSVGVLTYELLFGRVPFEIVTERDFIKIVRDAKFRSKMTLNSRRRWRCRMKRKISCSFA
jgi:aurora kinase